MPPRPTTMFLAFRSALRLSGRVNFQTSARPRARLFGPSSNCASGIAGDTLHREAYEEDGNVKAQHHLTLTGSVQDTTADAPQITQSPTQVASGGEVIQFGRFCVIPSARKLLVDGQSVELGSRTFDLLMVLVRARGSVVAKEAIVDEVWPGMVVDESNLRFQIAALRRALGADRDLVKTVSGRGYILAVDRSSEPPAPGEVDSRPEKGTPLIDPLATNAQGKPCAILILDGDADLRDAIGSFLRAMGLRVDVFASVEGYQRASDDQACRPQLEEKPVKSDFIASQPTRMPPAANGGEKAGL